MVTSLSVYYDVTAVEIIGRYTLRLTFDDGRKQVINFEPVLYGPVFEPLRELSLFNQVRLNQDTGTIEWPTGADFNPIVLHDWPAYQDKLIASHRKHQTILA
jgi:Protein of unknown function (DUF2442)